MTDNTKTRVGKEFYDKYFYFYNDLEINGGEIVIIGEEFSFGRNIKISVEINNEIIYEFIARPDEEFLESAASEAVNVTFFYFKEKEKLSKYFTQY
ncbi:curli production assembly/transport protein CsgE [Flavobacterium segetis]|uniref:curli production assembly/transport protein CsgE n=1 Tax=Flavobacterium segetis TaxID=271157 RepID=UPI001F3D2CEC|nr:curli production assembly/transport protein CsgE [Flavobacterium segetis]